MWAPEEAPCRFQGFSCSKKPQDLQTEWIAEDTDKVWGGGRLARFGEEWGGDCGILSTKSVLVTAPSAAPSPQASAQKGDVGESWVPTTPPTPPAFLM